MNITNKTNCKLAEQFIVERMKQYKTDNLDINMSYGNFSAINSSAGYCRYPTKKSASRRGWRFDLSKGIFKIRVRVNERILYPFQEIMSVATKPINETMWEWINDKEELRNEEENMVFVLGHEMWHFLCKTKQEKGNRQTKANAFGYKMLREFKIIHNNNI
jgi:hypothetical protein